MSLWSRISLSVCIAFLGCAPPAEPQAAATPEEAATSGGHAHDHDDMGPNGGHLLHLEPSGGHAEWTHDDESHLITVFLTDFEVDKISSVKFVATIGDTVEEFPLEAGEGDAWSISSEALMTHINMGDAATVQLVVADESGPQTSAIEAHEHHHH